MVHDAFTMFIYYYDNASISTAGISTMLASNLKLITDKNMNIWNMKIEIQIVALCYTPSLY